MQCMGYGLAGLARSCVVFPDYCIWPSTLATIVLNRSLHEKSSGVEFRFLRVIFNRYRYFLALTAAYIIWHLFIPIKILAYMKGLVQVIYLVALWKTSIGLPGFGLKAKYWP